MASRLARLCGWVSLATALVLGCGSSLGGAEHRSEDGLEASEGEDPPAALDASDWLEFRTKTRAKAEPFVAYTDPGELPSLEVADRNGSKLPLEHTHVSARLTGFVAEVEVTQTYRNPNPRPIEAVYVFPLPENSAVNHMRMVIGRRVIEAKIDERERARRTYESAKREGYTAALLEQERPNVFTQSVANIAPGTKIDVVVRYVQDLTYDAGQYEFVFPLVVGPRFMPGAKLMSPRSGSGTKSDTDQVPDASRISPPIVGRGERSGHDISLELVADAGLAIGSFEVPTHEVVTRRPADGTLRLTLAEKTSLPNRDFLLRYRVAGERPRATLYTSGSGDGAGGYFSLVVHPPELDIDELVGRREMVFVVDVSGSMSGVPLAMCKSAMRVALSQLRPVDTFNIYSFSGATARAFERPRPANTESVRHALALVDAMSAGGGTYMADAVAAALSPSVDPGRRRYVFFLTDGYVGNEAEIIATADRFVSAHEKRDQTARVFAFGVGSSVNRYLIDGLSRAGRGLAIYATAREDPDRAVNRFFHYVDRAVLTDLEVSWGGLQASEIYPQKLPDLFASHPVIVHGRFRGKADGPIQIRGRTGGDTVTLPVTMRPARSVAPSDKVLGTLWARSKIASLEEQMWRGSIDTPKAQITRLGLDFSIVTAFTSFVAVDSARRVSDGTPDRVVQPVEEPEGVDVDMAGGERMRSLAGGAGYGYEFSDDPLRSDGEILLTGPLAGAPAMQKSDTRAIREQVYIVERRRGCGCRLVAPERDLDGVALLGLSALLSFGFARRRALSARAGLCCGPTKSAGSVDRFRSFALARANPALVRTPGTRPGSRRRATPPLWLR